VYDVPQESLCGIAQQVYGWVCYRSKLEQSSFVVALPGLGGRGCYNMVS
jgi:hypothetical protein